METKTAEHAFQVDGLAPNIVDGIEKTGLEFGFLADLTLKTVYADADCSTERTAERLKLPMFVVEPILQHLYRERLIEIRELVGFENHRYSILDRGWDRVQRLLDQSGYIGPAPVSLDAYTTMVRKQQEQAPAVSPESGSRCVERPGVAGRHSSDAWRRCQFETQHSDYGSGGNGQNIDRQGDSYRDGRRGLDSIRH